MDNLTKPKTGQVGELINTDNHDSEYTSEQLAALWDALPRYATEDRQLSRQELSNIELYLFNNK